MTDSQRHGDATATQATLRILTQQLKQAQEVLSRWKVDFTVEVDGATLDIRVTALKPYGGGGVIKTIQKSTVLYYSDDRASLIQSVVQEIFEALLRDELVEALNVPLTSAVQTVLQVNNKQPGIL